MGTDCGSCLSKQDSFRYLCFWCPSDAEGNRCHDDGSVETGCTTATCISKSSLSTCDKGSCPSVAQNAKTALRSPVQTSPSTESKPFTSIMPAASNCSGITDCGSCSANRIRSGIYASGAPLTQKAIVVTMMDRWKQDVRQLLAFRSQVYPHAIKAVAPALRRTQRLP